MSGMKNVIILAEFENPAALLKAAEKLRDQKMKNFDCHSPFPIHGMNEAMGISRSFLGWFVGVLGFCAVITMTAFIWWVSVKAYPVIVSGKPLFSYQAYLPPIFAIGVLTGAVVAVLGMILLNQLPRLYHPLFYSERFAKVSDDGFFISLEGKTPELKIEDVKSLLESIGGKHVEVISPE